MRMRKKKNLDQRLESHASLHTDLYARPRGERGEPLDLDALFPGMAGAPLHLEIGCGKGGFMVQMAQRHPDVRFIGIELLDNVLVAAMEKTAESGVSNVHYLLGSAEILTALLPKESIERIYLNFSCPYPKARQAKHRLTYPRFLEIYRYLLAPDGDIYMKTDNRDFFEFSLNSFCDCGYRLKNISLDLHRNENEANVRTEYEEKFAALELPIYRLEARIIP